MGKFMSKINACEKGFSSKLENADISPFIVLSERAGVQLPIVERLFLFYY